jgi:hypothetical protein
MSHGPGGIHNDYIGSVNLPGNAQHAFDGPVFPRFHPGDSLLSTSLFFVGWVMKILINMSHCI